MWLRRAFLQGAEVTKHQSARAQVSSSVGDISLLLSRVRVCFAFFVGPAPLAFAQNDRKAAATVKIAKEREREREGVRVR